MSSRKRARWPKIIGAIAATLVAVGILSVQSAHPAEAVTGADWNAGRIIDDSQFYDADAMTQTQIANFISQQGANCSNGSAPCLKNYSTSTPSTQAGLCSAMAATSSSTAAQIIYRVANACGISPKVILVMIQKESSLVTATSPNSIMYRSATGFGCPDTAACDANYYGFFNQVYRMALQFQYYTNNPQSYGYQAGKQNTILYNPDSSCGSSSVYLQNQATTNLYIYTPYQPNQAALDNLYGEGNYCSAYGNRNFWRLYNDWFGGSVSAPAINPQGSLQRATADAAGNIKLWGWAYDGSSSLAAVTVIFTVNNEQASITTANVPRPDLANYGIPGNHGFDLTIKPVSDGENEVCATARNIGGGADVKIGCKSVHVSLEKIDPTGALQYVTLNSDGSLALKGWSYDGSAPREPVTMFFTVNGKVQKFATANLPYPVLANYGIPGDHGYELNVGGGVNGLNKVCAFAGNILGGQDRIVGCKEIEIVLPGSPRGRVQSTTQSSAGTVTVAGYAYDPSDYGAATPITVTENGTVIGGSAANRSTPSLAVYGIPGNHGYSVSFVPKSTGATTYCVEAANSGAGGDISLGCSTLEIVAPGSPRGSVQSLATVGGKLTLAGWAWDQDDPLGAVALMVTVNGEPKAFLPANRSTPSLTSYGIPGNHGFSYTWTPATPTGNSVCVFAFNTGPGENKLLGCRSN